MARPVLVFNAVPHAVVAVARSLNRRGIPVTFADITGNTQPPPSRAIRDFVQLPSHRDSPEEFIESLTAYIESNGHDMLIPLSDPGLAAAIDNYDRLSALLHVGCPPPQVVRRVLEKERTLEAASACGILIPGKYTLPNSVEIEGLRSRLRFPIVAKPLSKEDETHHTFKMRYFSSFQDLRDAFLVDPQFGKKNLFQEFCAGEGVGIEVLLHDGEPLALFQHRRFKELPVTGGGSVTSISEPLNPDLVEQAVALLRRLEWEGVAMVEFKVDRESRRAVLMEVNGRYWGSIPLAIGAGIDFPLYEWQLAHGEKPAVPASYRTGLRFRWLSGDIRRLGSLFTEPPEGGFPLPSKAGEVIRFFTDFAHPTCPAVWSWSDPMPAYRQCRSALKGVMTALVKTQIKACKQLLAEYRYHGGRIAMLALRLRLLYAAGLRRAARPGDLSQVRSVLFVCHGNIIRSAMAEALLRKYMDATPMQIASAGLTDTPQERADSRSRAIAPEFGASLEDHRPQRLTPELIDRFDLIFIMDYFNEARMLVKHPAAKPKYFYLGALSGSRRSPELPDPNLGAIEDVRRCYRALDIQVRELAGALQRSQTKRQSTSMVSSASQSL